jgi:hypothetical protein
MATPSYGQISIGDLKAELSLVGGASYDISLSDCNSYIMANGFYDTYGYNRIIGSEVPLSNFYLLETFAAYDFLVGSSITDYNNFKSSLSNLSSAGGNSGANASPNSFDNPSSGTLSPGNSNAINITHMDELIVGVNCFNNSPRPPFTNLYVEWDNGGGYTGFPGSPFNGPIINVNSGTQSNAGNASPGTPTFSVFCYQ